MTDEELIDSLRRDARYSECKHGSFVLNDFFIDGVNVFCSKCAREAAPSLPQNEKKSSPQSTA